MKWRLARFAVHEGNSLTANDGSSVYLVATSTPMGAESMHTADATGSIVWTELVSDFPLGLLTEQIFSAGFEAGSVCPWSAYTGGLSCP